MKDIINLNINNPIVRDHIVRENHLLPGLAYIDIIFELFRERNYDYRNLILRNIRIYKPFIVDKKSNTQMEIECVESETNYWKINIRGKKAQDELYQSHLTAEMYLEDIYIENSFIDFDEIFNKKPIKNISLTYEVCKNLQLIHGDFMKAKGILSEDEKCHYGKLYLGDEAMNSYDEFMFHPTLLDTSAVTVAGEIALKEGDDKLFLPICIDEFSASELINKNCIVRVVKDNVIEKDEVVSLTLEYYNDKGYKVGELKNLYGKVVRNSVEKSENKIDYKNIIKKLIGKKLNVPSDSIETGLGYYELGLGSTEILEIMKELEDTLNINMNPIDLFENPTVDKLSDHLNKTYKNSDKDLNTHYKEKNYPKVEQKYEKKVNVDNEDIAIIGMDGTYPKANNLEEFWDNLKNGIDCITEIPNERWDKNLLNNIKSPSGKRPSIWGGFIDNYNCFDPQFFRISPREAEFIDPQERIFLQTCWSAIEDAGYTVETLVEKDKYERNDVGVFVGVMHRDYLLVGADEVRNGKNIPLPMVSSSVANRVSYFCNFHGPSISIDTACSSSLTAVHLAVQSIKTGESKVAIVGGVNLSLHPDKYMTYGLMDMHSPSGRCKSFGENADGYVSSEGVGAIVLKPLSKAIEDKDNIYSVIKATTINHGGTVSGITVPCPIAQGNLIKRTLDKVNIDSRTIGYVEAHGTGTSLGDPIEIKGLINGFSEYGPRKEKCAIGAVKSNIGHTESASGIAGLQKVVLQLINKTLVKSLHSENKNPYIDFDKTPFQVQQECEYWKKSRIDDIEYPRRGTISSFGATGSNGYIILEEYKSQDEILIEEKSIVPLSAKNVDRLEEYLINLKSFLKNKKKINLTNLAYTLQVGRRAMEERIIFIVSSIEELIKNIENYLNDGTLLSGYRGNANKNRDTLEVFTEEDDLDILVNRWISKNELNKIARLWAQGGTIKWNKFISKKKRISLPGYPFAKEKYWYSKEKNDNKIVMNTNTNTEISSLLYVQKWEEEELKNNILKVNNKILILHSKETLQFANDIEKFWINRNPNLQIIKIDLDEEHFKVSEDKREYNLDPEILASIDCVYFLTPYTNLTNNELINKCNVYEVEFLRLVKSLRKASKGDNQIHCFIVTMNKFSIYDSNINPIAGGITGLAYSLAQGDYKFLVRNIDIDYKSTLNSTTVFSTIKSISSEPNTDSGKVVKYENNTRFIQMFYSLKDKNSFNNTGLKDKGVYVILGGSGKIGNVITKNLINKYNAKVVWIGRKSETDRDIQDKLKELNKLDGEVYYVQGDINNYQSINSTISYIINKFGKINGAIFSGLVINFENSIRNTTEQEFIDIYNVKSKGVINFYEVLKDYDLDFLCYFSSAQSYSFSGATTLAGYASGITFADTYVKSIIPKAKYPVGIINWGFWESSFEGNVEDFHHIKAIAEESGFKVLEWFTSVLKKNRLNQVIAMELTDEVKELMGLNQDKSIELLEDELFDKSNLFNDFLIEDLENENINDKIVYKKIEKTVAKILYAKLNEINVFDSLDDQADIDEVFLNSNINQKYRKWFHEAINILSSNEFISLNEGNISISNRNSEVNSFAEWNDIKEEFRDDIKWKAQINLLNETLSSLTEIITGELIATEVLFPNSSMDLVEGIYKENPYSDFFNNSMSSTIEKYICSCINNNPNAKINIIEAGSGTGGTTKGILETLDKYKEKVTYYYTDVSKSFLDFGEKNYGGNRDYLKYSIWDIESNELKDDIMEGHFNIVLASNVIHATKNIANTLRNLKRVLKMGGLLILNEGKEKSPFITLTFGLLDGWWAYEDESIRINGSPLLDEQNWDNVLFKEGFKNTLFPIKTNRQLPYQIIISESDGNVEHLLSRIKPLKIELQSNIIKEKSIINNNNLSKKEFVESILKEELGKQLKLAKEKIDSELPFSDYGVDSLIGVSFIKNINNILEIDLKTSILFDYIKISSLAKYILQNCNITFESDFEDVEILEYRDTIDALEVHSTEVHKHKDEGTIDLISEKFINKEINTDELLNLLIQEDEIRGYAYED